MTTHDPFRPGPRAASRRVTLPRQQRRRRQPADEAEAPSGRAAGRRTTAPPSPADRAPTVEMGELVGWIREAGTIEERDARIGRARASEQSRREPRNLVLATLKRLEAEPFPVVPAAAGEPAGQEQEEGPAPLAETVPDGEGPAPTEAVPGDVPEKATAVVAWLRDATSDTDRDARARAALEIESSRDTPRKVVQDAIVRVLGEDA